MTLSADQAAARTQQSVDQQSVGQQPVGRQSVRQQVLVLYLASSALDSDVVGWSTYDGTGQSSPTTGDSDEPPYETGLDALKDGWRLFQAAQLLPPQPGHEYDMSFLKHEFFFEKLS